MPHLMGREGSYEGWIFDSQNKVNIEQENMPGLEASTLGSFQLTHRLELQAGIALCHVSPHASVEQHTTYPNGSLWGSGSSYSYKKVDGNMLMLAIPAYVRWHWRPKTGARNGANFFVDFGSEYHVSVINKVNVSSEKNNSNAVKMDTSPWSVLCGMGVAIGDKYAITLGVSYLENEQTNTIAIRKLTLTRMIGSVDPSNAKPTGR